MQDITETLGRYVNHKISPGSFLKAVLENDLKRSFETADFINRARMAEIVEFVYKIVPFDLCGSKEKVKNHLDSRKISE
jgi:hypothetical protein